MLPNLGTTGSELEQLMVPNVGTEGTAGPQTLEMVLANLRIS